MLPYELYSILVPILKSPTVGVTDSFLSVSFPLYLGDIVILSFLPSSLEPFLSLLLCICILEDRLDWALIAWIVCEVWLDWAAWIVWIFWANDDPIDINGLFDETETLVGSWLGYIYAGCNKLEIEFFWTGVPFIEILEAW